jgi:hypothetical protein
VNGWLAISVPTAPSSYNGLAFVALVVFCVVALASARR